MRHAILRTLACTALASFLLVGGHASAADDLAIEAFYGTFEGTGLARSDESDYFGLTVRDLDVTIGSAEGGGLSVAWTTVLRQGGDPDNPDVRRKTNAIMFEPSDLPGIYRARTAGNPLKGEPLTWAYTRGRTLTVHSLVVLGDGDYVMQTYNRTLSDLGMELEFVSVKNGETARRVKGRLTRQAN